MNALARLCTVWNLILVLSLAVVFLLVVYPMATIFQASFLDPDTSAFTLDNYAKIFSTKFYLRCLGNSLFVSALATLASLAIGIPFGFLTTRVQLPGASWLRTLGTLPLILPTFVGAEAWLLLLGRNGALTNLLGQAGVAIPSIYGWQGVALVFTLQFFPFVFLMVSAAINSIDGSLEEAARNLGAGSWRVFSTVTLPVVAPAVASGGLMVFFMSIENFGVPHHHRRRLQGAGGAGLQRVRERNGRQPLHGRGLEHGAGGHHPFGHRGARSCGWSARATPCPPCARPRPGGWAGWPPGPPGCSAPGWCSCPWPPSRWSSWPPSPRPGGR